ncbi:MAG TPA: glycosyl hydrolase-related protein, partial [Candidatus Paceibacterota bacterium]
YLEAADYIANKIKKLSIENIITKTAFNGLGLYLFNSLNWDRSETIYFESKALENNKQYTAVDMDNNIYPIIKNGNGFLLYVRDIPGVGYKALKIIERYENLLSNRTVLFNDENIVLGNLYYEIAIDKNKGTLLYIKDLSSGLNIIGDTNFLEIVAYDDFSFSVNEKITDKVAIDSTKNHIKEVSLLENNSIFTKIAIISEICDSKVVIDITLNNMKKEIIINPKIYWIGTSDKQLNMNMNFSKEYNNAYYSVPYGVQKVNNNMLDPNIFLIDEISIDLYKTLKEVIGWFALENGNSGISIATNQSAYSFKGSFITAVLLRSVRSGGDHTYVFSNEGELNWEFRLSTYEGNFETSNSYKAGWEMQYPTDIVIKNTDYTDLKQKLPMSESFIKTSEGSILTVIKKSDFDEDKYILRAFNSTSIERKFEIETSFELDKMETCNLMESQISDCIKVLKPFEIKTIKLTKKINLGRNIPS